MYKTYIYKYAKNTVSKGMLENSRLDVKPHLFVDIGPIIYGRVRVVSHNLVPNNISSNT
jgi:hypothetical protein